MQNQILEKYNFNQTSNYSWDNGIFEILFVDDEMSVIYLENSKKIFKNKVPKDFESYIKELN